VQPGWHGIMHLVFHLHIQSFKLSYGHHAQDPLSHLVHECVACMRASVLVCVHMAAQVPHLPSAPCRA